MTRLLTRHLTRRLTRPGASAALGVAAAVLVLAGCGSSGGARVVPGAPGGGTDSAADCGDVVLDLTAGGTPREICLSVGSSLRLRSGPGAQPVRQTGGALSQVSPGVYRGIQPGPAELSGTRRVCPPRHGQVSCMAIVHWHVTVNVR